jgi:anaerobic C4-dicarboxylate transporter
MVDMDNLGRNYIGIYYITLSFIMLGMVNLTANLWAKTLSLVMIEVDNS